jgi:integrase
MRIAEALQLRVKDLDFDHRVIVVRHGKGGKDRVVMLPGTLVAGLHEQLARAHALWQADAAAGRGGVQMPDALERKYPRAGATWGWFWVFPQAEHSVCPRTGVQRRHHLFDQTFQRASSARCLPPASCARPRRTRCAMLLPPTCCRLAGTSAPCRSCWATAMSAPP